MLNFVTELDILDLGIHHPEAMLKERRQIPAADVTVFIDGSGQNTAAVFQIPGRIIRAPSEKRDPKRRPADDHLACSPSSKVPLTPVEEILQRF
jgi:hypothetical protein